MKTPIEGSDIRPGDLIRWESNFPDSATAATEFRAGTSVKGYHAAGTYYLLDRPRVIKWLKGSTLWFKESMSGVPAGTAITVTADCYEDDRWVHTDYTDTGTPQQFQSHRFTDTRPTPPDELPTEPTLGWVEHHDERDLDFWRGRSDHGPSWGPGVWAGRERERGLNAEFIRSWMPAVAIPKAALDELRRVAALCDASYPDCERAINDFLAAVANEAQA